MIPAPYQTALWILFLIAAIVVSVFYALSRNNRVAVLGIDHDTGYRVRRVIKPNRDGSVTYKRVGRGGKCRIPLDARYSGTGPRYREYLADVTPGQGILLHPTRDGKFHRMSGDRHEDLAEAGIFKEISDSAKTDINELANKAIIAISIAGGILVIMIGYVIYALQKGGIV